MNDDKEELNIQEEKIADEVADEILTVENDEYEQRSFWFIVLFLFCLIFLVSSLSFAVFDTYYNGESNNVITVDVDENVTQCDKNCDTDNDGICNYNCDMNNDGICDKNCDNDSDGKCDENCDDSYKKPSNNYYSVCKTNCDVNNNGICNYNCDTNNDGNCDKNCDTNNDGVCDKHCDSSFQKPEYPNNQDGNGDEGNDVESGTKPQPSESEKPASGSILFSFNEESNYINMTGVYPTSDTIGKKLVGDRQYFDFSISASMNKNKGNLVYEISLVPISENTIPENMVRVYLTENGKDVSILDKTINNYSELPNSKYRNGGKVIYSKKISKNYNGEYVFRMWLSSKAPVYNSSKKFGVKIAVNAYYK